MPLSRGLGFVLTFWVVAWPSASIPAGSAGSGWWGTQEALALRQAARVQIQKGDFSESERLLQGGADLAVQRHDPLARAWFLSGVGDARFARFDYRGALSAYLEARQQAEKARNRLCLGAIDFNLSSLYQQMWDSGAALRYAEEAQKIVEGLANVYYRPQLLLQLGRLRANSSRSIPLYREAIDRARTGAAKDPSLAAVEANGWDLLAEALLAGGDKEDAEQAIQSALALRQRSVPRDLGFSYWRLGALRLREGLLQEAERFTRLAMQERWGPPRYLLQYQLGRILLARHRAPEALLAMEAAVDQAQRWRVGIAPAFPVLDAATSELEARIFEGFVEAATDYGIQTHNPRWIAESLQAAELNRAINFQNSTQSGWQRRLPLEYWEVLSRLKTEESQPSASSDRLQMRLTEMEVQVGLDSSPINAEKFPSRDSLSLFRKRLKDSEVLLSFSLGEKESFLWAVTRNTLHVYRIPPAEQIRNTVRDFRQAVESEEMNSVGETGPAGGTDIEDMGGRVYAMLFGQLQARETSKPAWLISPEDGLLALPFGALVVEREQGTGVAEREQRTGGSVFLIERHSLQMIAGALLPESPAPYPAGGFLSVGDAIYNVADPRWNLSLSPMGRLHSWFLNTALWTSFTGETAAQLNRLPGSGREVEASAAAWGLGPATRVLEGADASLEKFKGYLAPVPEVIHLATHAATPSSGEEAYLVFGLGANGRPETLSISEVRPLQVPGAVVVMTGCATAPSEVRTGLGLAGLVRAWTVAGASAVVATEWAVGDNTGTALLSSFYKHLHEVPNSVAEALRRAQVEMIRTGTQGSPGRAASWAAYQVFSSRLTTELGPRNRVQ